MMRQKSMLITIAALDLIILNINAAYFIYQVTFH